MDPDRELGPVREVIAGRRAYFGFLAAACAAVGALCVYCGAAFGEDRLWAGFFFTAAALLAVCAPLMLRLAAARVTLCENGLEVRVFSARRIPLADVDALDWRDFGRRGGCLYLCLKSRPAVPVPNALFPAALYDRLRAYAGEAGVPQRESDRSEE